MSAGSVEASLWDIITELGFDALAAAVIGIIVVFVTMITSEVLFEIVLELMGMGFWLSLIRFAILMGLANNIRD